MKTILALDASSTSIGWVLWDGSNALHHGTITLPGEIGQRLCLAETAIASLISRYCPSVVAIERPAYGRTDAIVPQQRVAGVILLVVARAGLFALEVASNSAKKALADYGKASKSLMITSAAPRLAGAVPIRVVTLRSSQVAINAAGLVMFTEHTADALGIALAAWNGVKVEEPEEVAA
jgi:Holliday junction resolvasome RuvABC endonuclease subunit